MKTAINKPLDLAIQAMLTEYQQLRAETRDIMQRQYTMLSLLVTSLGVILGIGIKIYQDAPAEKFNEQSLLVLLVFCLLVPGIMAFLGALWLDGVYRQVKIGTYISALEKKINYLLEIPQLEEQILYWEQWNYDDKIMENNFFLFNVNHYQYYIGLGLFLVAPPLSMSVGAYMARHYFSIWILVIGIVFYILYWLFAVVYILKIKSQAKKIPQRIKKAQNNDLHA